MMHTSIRRALTLVFLAFALGCGGPQYDLVLRGGSIVDGSGGAPVVGDVAISGDSIVAMGPALEGRGRRELDVTGLVVAPGFINMLSWATESLFEDGRSQSDIRQGVTLEVMGEGNSMGPLSDSMRVLMLAEQEDIKYPVTWTTLGGYLDTLAARGVSTNIASFVGATTVRIHELGYDDRAPTPAELERMQALVRQAMEEGALGVGSSLIYAPAFYAKTPELVALAQAAAPYGGMYITHLRSEGNQFVQAVEEFLTIVREGGLRGEIYHLKAAGQTNWPKMDTVLTMLASARASGLEVTADIYPYPAGATGLDAAMPPWVQEGGYAKWAERLRDPAIRARVRREMRTPSNAWENLYLAAGSPERVVLAGFKTDSLRRYTGMTLAAVARARGTGVEDTAMDLVVQDGSRVGTIYFLMSEENIAKQLAWPFVSVGSDAASPTAEGVFLNSNPHPRAYGSFARILAKYVREDSVLTLQEAVRRMTSLPAGNLRLQRRGSLASGFYADVVVFDAARVQDHATFEKPHQYATGVQHVFVNGVQVLADGEHTGAKPGRVVRGAGYRGGAQR